MKSLKFLGLCIAFSFIGMTVYNAVTGYNIQDNGNLNIAVLASESSGSGSGVGITSFQISRIDDPNKPREVYHYTNHLGEKCDSIIDYYKDICNKGGDEFCVPKDVTVIDVTCIKKL